MKIVLQISLVIILLSGLDKGNKIFAQPSNYIDKTVEGVYKNLINAIGDKSHVPPSLHMVYTENVVAQYIPKRNRIEFEYLAYEICRKLNADSLNAVAFILAHELAHYYKDHDWLSQAGSGYASSDLGKKLLATKVDLDKTIKYETEADEFSCYYSKMAGYSIQKASLILESVYKGYDLPDQIQKYPSLKERAAIANRVQKETAKLNRLFDFASMLLLQGEYRCAILLYHHILNKQFGSRELFNNVGVAYALQGLQYAKDEWLKVTYPFSLDPTSRLVDLQRSNSEEDSLKASNYFTQAEDNFERAIQLDKSYLPAQINLALVKALKYEFDDANYFMGKAEKSGTKTPNDLVDISYAKAIIYYLENARTSNELKQLSEKGDLRASQTLKNISGDSVISSKTAFIPESIHIKGLRASLRKSHFKEVPFAVRTDDGIANIYQRDSADYHLVLLEFKGLGGFSRIIQTIEKKGNMISELEKEEINKGTVLTTFQQGSYSLLKRASTNYNVYQYLLNEDIERIFFVFN